MSELAVVTLFVLGHVVAGTAFLVGGLLFRRVMRQHNADLLRRRSTDRPGSATLPESPRSRRGAV